MNQFEFLTAFATACAKEEGFFINEVQAKARKMTWPTRAQKNGNPLNLRAWGSYPIEGGYAKFPGPDMDEWHDVDHAASKCIRGWTAALRQCERCIFERNLTFKTFFAGQRNAAGSVLSGGYPGFAPAADANKPLAYAAFVCNEMKLALRRDDFTVDTKISAVFDNVK